MIRGEYWITETGDLRYVWNPPNHAELAMERAIDMIYAAAPNDPVAEMLLEAVPNRAWKGDAIWFRTELLDASDRLSRKPGYEELYDDYEECLLRAGLSQDLLSALWADGCDPRVWAEKELGWICVKPGFISLHMLTDRTVQRLRDGLHEILRVERQCCPEDAEFEIQVFCPKLRYRATWQQLQEGRASLLYPIERVSADAVVAGN